MKKTTNQPWSVRVGPRDVPEAGRHFNLVAGEQERAAVAGVAGLRTLPRLEASLDVRRHGREGLRVTGQVSATVGQECVVTLEPMESEVAEPVEVTFTPDARPGAAAAILTEEDIAGADGPEPLVGGSVDLGAIATEFLLLGIDPYPRKPDAVFEAQEGGEPAAHPFAALAALKKEPRGGR